MKIFNICLGKKGGGLEKMAINYHLIMSEHESIFRKNSWIENQIDIESNNIIFIKYWIHLIYILWNLNDKTLFICHCKRSLYYLNWFKYLGFKIITCIVNHNHYKIKKTINADYHINITSNMNKYFDKDKYKTFTLNNFSIRPERSIELKNKIRKIGFIGRIETRKGCLLMLNQIKDLVLSENFIVNIYGDGSEKSSIIKFIEDNNLNKNIILHGWIDDISECYKSNDIIIVPSIYEPFGLVIIDSFYYNCATIISNNILIKDDILENNCNCLLYDIKDNNQLEQKIKLLINNKDVYYNIQKNGFLTYKNRLDHKQAKNNLKNIIEQIQNIENSNLYIHHEFDKIKNKLLKNEYFTYVRFGDGEMNYIERKEHIHETHTTKKGEIPKELSDLIKKSLEFNKENYYVGIPCGCCEHRDNFRERLLKEYNINKSNLTFASVFCNIMNFRFKNEIIPILKNYPIILVSNKKTNIYGMKDQGFNIIKWFSVDYNAWKNYQDIVDQVTNYQKEQNIVNHLFIFCAGPISNVIAYQLVQQENKNIYLDIGSSLDEELGLGRGTRNYNKLFGWKTISTCYWNKPINWYQVSCDSQEKSKLFRTLLRILAFSYRVYYYIYFIITDFFYIKD